MQSGWGRHSVFNSSVSHIYLIGGTVILVSILDFRSDGWWFQGLVLVTMLFL